MLLVFGQGRLDRVPSGAIAGVWRCTTTQIVGQSQIIPEGTEFRSGGGYKYLTIGDKDPTEDLIVRAVDAGLESDLQISDELKSASPLPSINDIIIVAEELTTPVAAETLDEYRSDVLETFTLAPSGGNAGDYILWASDVIGARTVFPYAKDGEVGKVQVFVEGANPIVPTQAIIDEVIEALKYDENGNGRAPVHVFPFIDDTNVVAVRKTDINIVINGGISGELAQATAIIEAYLYGIRPYLATLNTPRDEDKDTIKQSAIITALASGGLTFSDIVLKSETIKWH